MLNRKTNLNIKTNGVYPHRRAGRRCDIILHNGRATTLTPEMLYELLIVPTVITGVHVVREYDGQQERERREEELDTDTVPNHETRGGDRQNNAGPIGNPSLPARLSLFEAISGYSIYAP